MTLSATVLERNETQPANDWLDLKFKQNHNHALSAAREIAREWLALRHLQKHTGEHDLKHHRDAPSHDLDR